jgi:CRISPR-associated protein Csm1
MCDILAKRAALEITQQAIKILFDRAKVNLPTGWQVVLDKDVRVQRAIDRAKKLLQWSDNSTLQPLRVLFDFVHLSQGQQEQHYWEIKEIEDSEPTIPYPLKERPTETKVEDFTVSIRQKIEQLNLDSSDWQNLSLLSLILEKYGCFLSFCDEDIALVDLVRSTAAVAAALADNPEATDFSLIAGDLSGIQNFIYTISSDGALKSLRARSFYLELVTEEIVQQLLNVLQLPRTNVIYAGGGNLYILALATEENKNYIKDVCQQLNKWLLNEFQGKVFLALDNHDFPIEDIASDRFADRWTKATKKLAVKKAQKFASQIGDLLQQQNAYEPCKVCHRDDVKNLEPLNDDNSPLACGTCHLMFQLGRELFKVSAIVRSQQKIEAGERLQIAFRLPETESRSPQNIYYYLFEEWKQIFPESETVLLVNDWTIEHYKFSHFRNPILLLLGNYGQQTQIPGEKGFISASELAKKAKEDGIERVGYLRMDVDNLGQIFARGLKQQEKQTLPRIAGLSRQMSYFFKVYLNSLAEKRHDNFNFPCDSRYKKIELSKNKNRDNLLFIYAGGDDLFVSGSWNEVVEFGFDVYQCFRAYTGHHPDITISAGITLEVPNFPLYQAAERSGEAEEKAKGNGRDSLGLFGQVFKWDEWLGNENFQVIDGEIRDYLSPEPLPSIFGIYPFVRKLNQPKDINYSRSFVRNLLTTAEIQEQKLKEAKNEPEEHRRDLRYFLHLPKIAYTLARLPKEVRDKEDFGPINTSLKNPWNANYFRAIATWLELLNRD